MADGGKGRGKKANGGGRGGAARHGQGGGQGGGRQDEIRVLLSGEVRRKVTMWVCFCDYAHLPRDVACRKCGCMQSNPCSLVQQWWNDERLPSNWRGTNHPMSIGAARKSVGKGSKGGGKEKQEEERRREPTLATRPKAMARPPNNPVAKDTGAAVETEQEDKGWQQGGPSAKQRKKAKREANRSLNKSKEDEDMGGNEWSDEHEEQPQKTRPIVLLEVPRVTLVRRLEARKGELEEARNTEGSKPRVKKLERRINELEQMVKI